MITYVHCLSPEPVVSCWHRACYEDPPSGRRTLCSFKPANKMGNSLQPEAFPSPRPARPEGCLRKRLLSVSKVHQKQDSLWTPKPLLGPDAKGSPGKKQTYQDGKDHGLVTSETFGLWCSGQGSSRQELNDPQRKALMNTVTDS
ncbi:NHS-like protein 1 [Lates japonicus]|uniref:NHS-like protein 1 n=1 Tax=Lates japonicus TaxID=270547 RepID=A0AAD3NFN2_LATJO|nr:NHS-like protein 1 [Lates japonicus]